MGCSLGQTKERDRELGSHRRMKGWGGLGTTAPLFGEGGQVPWGRKLALFLCTEGGPGRVRGAGSVLGETGAELRVGAQVAPSP